ncbi:hypothetical protein PSN45_000493 [Yamadazyma tenuis]|uniref:LicD/FKTN/FKRP nucleotidyltransferase domain-containing protein n=1 Tax=Candida tenuis (strain ATCC 10573 / BCRC 21748 / CBS 615 / JCM 9827 / NBRC 10315 / NRRL Y-1498 / VKM Y-70) TaxID=590646 RepID=G3B8Y7_CANTC|nr:uncharacterized protein CANTEDRAFT_115246 [Yamadazyma tenuis ATCC 10573]EGV61807.1 hypothetical protein CANTEDRAFT_115246 [Yamadazyma tenuis ATCC 10573]WEJ93033.1 hypothetical protein PSN45_000493 [Yamadazyma tenuis]
MTPLPRLYNKKLKFWLPLFLVVVCGLFQLHAVLLTPVNQQRLDLEALHLQRDSGFNPKLSTYSLYTFINKVHDGAKLHLHWDDLVDLSPGSSMVAQFRQIDDESRCSAEVEAFGSVNSYWLESYETKVLRSMANLFCLKDVPDRVFVRSPTGYLSVPVEGRRRYGSLLNTSFSNNDFMNEYNSLDANVNHYDFYPLNTLNKSVDIDVNQFYFDPEYEMIKLTQSQNKHQLSPEDSKYLGFLKYANSIVDDSDRYFKYPWIYSDVVQGNSHHLAHPFFKRFISIRERQSIIQHMIRAWFEFAEAIDVPSWVNYGSLLGWAYNGVNMPWDTDVDIQLSIRHLDYLSRHYNNSLVLENPQWGNAKYLLDISPTYVRQGNGRNFIDGRFIDINSGLYIDISALSHTNFNPPSTLAGDDNDILVHCKHFNWHSLSEILPLRHTYFEGSSVYIPSNISSILDRKYGKESFTTKLNFMDYNYQDDINLWVPDSVCAKSPEINRFQSSSRTSLTLPGACDSRMLQDEYNINYQFGHRHLLLNADIDHPVDYNIKDLGDLPITRKDTWSYYHDLHNGLVHNENWFHEYND